MSDVGGPFEAGDAVSSANPIFQRLICAYPEGKRYIVKYETGGVAYFQRQRMFDRAHGKWLN